MTHDDVHEEVRRLPDLPGDPRAEQAALNEALATFEVAHGRGVLGGVGLTRLARAGVSLGLVALTVVYLDWAMTVATSLSR